jgi:hypothetical protein
MSLPLPLHIVPREEDPMMRPTRPMLCARARAMQKAAIHDMFAFARTPDDVAARIAAIADVEVAAVPGTEEVVDDIYARACHGHGLPCRDVARDTLLEVGEGDAEAAGESAGAAAVAAVSALGTVPPAVGDATTTEASVPGSRLPAATNASTLACLSVADVEVMVRRGDAHYTRRFDNAVTRLLSYPLAAQVVSMLRAAALGEVGHPRMVLRAGHDTVVRPLMAALQIGGAPYPWPNYAARIIFELWRLPAAAAGGQQLAEPQHAVRVVYNGADVTATMPCAGDGSSGGSGSGSGSYCLLDALERQVAALIAPFTDAEHACFVPDEAGTLVDAAAGGVHRTTLTDAKPGLQAARG